VVGDPVNRLVTLLAGEEGFDLIGHRDEFLRLHGGAAPR
jgi:hypothetical protein